MSTRLVSVCAVAVVLTIVVVAAVAVMCLEHGSEKEPETVYPLGNPDYNFYRDADVGTSYVMIVTGVNDSSDMLSGSLASSNRFNIGGTCVVEVIAASDTTLTMKEVLTLDDGSDAHAHQYVVDRATGNIEESLHMLTASSNPLQPHIEEKWGPHHVDCTNYTVAHDGIVHSVFTYRGVDDSVCYYCCDSYKIVTYRDGHELTSTYSLEYTLDQMNFIYR